MNITIDLSVKDEQQKKELEEMLFIIWKNILNQKDESFLKMQEVSLQNIWDDEDLENMWKIVNENNIGLGVKL